MRRFGFSGLFGGVIGGEIVSFKLGMGIYLIIPINLDTR